MIKPIESLELTESQKLLIAFLIMENLYKFNKIPEWAICQELNLQFSHFGLLPNWQTHYSYKKGKLPAFYDPTYNLLIQPRQFWSEGKLVAILQGTDTSPLLWASPPDTQGEFSFNIERCSDELLFSYLYEVGPYKV